MKWFNRVAAFLPLPLIAQFLHAQSKAPAATAPANNGVILFASNRDGDFEIYRVKPDGSELAQLTDHAADDTSPSCSPDGKTLAFVSTRTGGHAVFTMNADGEVKGIADGATESTHISWAPDGRRLVCDLESGIYVMNADGTEQKQLSNDGMMPSWSPDGKTIAFNRGQLPHIFLMDTDGSNIRSLVVETLVGLPELSPIWSPDGKTILFTAVAGVKTTDTGKRELLYRIRTVDPDGKNAKSILETHGRALCWSPDGNNILLIAGTRDDMDLYTVKSDGTQLTVMAKSSSKEMSGCWSASIEDFPTITPP